MSQSTTGHPKGLYVLFVTEMWERFSYYGMRAIFTLYMTKALLFDKALGSDIYGSYTGLVYLTPLLGGYMADRYWGNRKSIIIGGFLMAIGQFLMFASGSLYQEVGLSSMIMYTGLAFLIFGNGFFKPNISTMVGQLYPQGDKRVDSAFTIFYMGINLGAFLSPLVCGTLGDTGNPADFKWGFLAAGVGMLLSTLLFIWLKDHYIVTPDGTPIGTAPNQSRKTDTPPIDTAAEVKKDFSMQQILTWAGVEVGLFVLFYLLDFGVIGSFIFSLTIAAPGFIISDRSLNKEERERIWVIYIIAFFVIFFWAAFEQAGASLTYFAEEQTDRTVNLTLSKTFLLGLIAIVVGILAWLFNKVLRGFQNEQRGVKELFMLLLGGGIAYGVYSIFQLSDEGIYIEQIPTSFFQSINAIAIVIFAPLFALLWTWMGNKNIEPASPYKQAIGLFLLAVGYAVIAIGVKDVTAKVSMMWLVSLYTIHTFGELCLSPIGLSMVNKLAPVKFASLLMGVWFLSTSAANKFAGVLSGLYPENGISKQFIGFQITDLYDFFMIFVVMAGVAAIILFVLSNKLLKMMHGVR
ncbi:MAG: peptide MFS transporter [Bacteroidia bacterium]|jgi:POT family proton-dependent oligopeptide transporter|nr:peptide MFS transporter [Bacteroidia bacterium]